jgi:hypothetical protein
MAEMYQVVVTMRGMQRNHAKMLAKELEGRYVQEEDTVPEAFRTTVQVLQMTGTVRGDRDATVRSGGQV